MRRPIVPEDLSPAARCCAGGGASAQLVEPQPRRQHRLFLPVRAHVDLVAPRAAVEASKIDADEMRNSMEFINKVYEKDSEFCDSVKKNWSVQVGEPYYCTDYNLRMGLGSR